jgi:putative ABC transport system permease protein
MGWRGFFRRIAFFARREQLTDDLREEMRLHLELRARKLHQRGLGVDDAGYAARRQFGNPARYQDQASQEWGWTVWERIVQDFRLGARTLRRTPGFTAIAVSTLAIGLGINTAVYSVVNAVMLQSLPYPQPDRLVSMWEEHPANANAFSSSGAALSSKGGAGALSRTTVSVANLQDYQRSSAFDGMASFDLAPMNLTGNGTPERIAGEAVSANFLSVLRIAPVRGRDFLPQDDSPQAEPVVMVTYDFWQNRLGGDSQVLERAVTLDGKPRRIVGVLPRGFQSPMQFAWKDPIEFYVPAAYPKAQFLARGDHDVNVVARLKSGVSMEAARADLKVIQSRLARQFPRTNKDMHPAISLLRDDLLKDASSAMWALLGASGLLVLITCVNVANLLLVRAAGRRREASVRLAVGASRLRLIRQSMAESLLVAAAGCAAGIALGRLFMGALVALAPAEIPRIHSVAMDWGVFAVAAAVATLTGFAFGMAPAWQTSQANPVEALKTAARGTAAKTQVRWRAALMVTEVALSLVLLVGAGLLLRSFAAITGVDLGFQPGHVLAMNINLPDLRYKTAALRVQFFDELERRVRALPGVQQVAYANRMPMRGSWRSGFELENAPERVLTADFQAVNSGYFETLGIALLRGRRLTPHDREGEPPVAVVNQAFSRAFLNGADPLGRVFLYSDNKRVQIVGVVTDIRRGGKAADVLPEVYLAAAQTSLYPVRIADLAVRASGDPSLLVNAVRQQVLAIDKDQPVTNVRTMEEIIDASVAQRRFQTFLLLVFAAVAVALALIGIYGVLAYSVAQRTQELGIRIALGANPRSVIALVLRQAGVLIAAGIALGVLGSLALTRYLQSLLFEVGITDWRTYAAAIALLALAGAMASLVPAVRGARVDPMVALREE